MSKQNIPQSGKLPPSNSPQSRQLASMIQRGREFQAREMLQEAGDMFRQALSIEPHNAEASMQLGIVETGLGRGQNAIRLLKSVLKTNRKNANVHQALGDAYRSIDDSKQALACYRKAVALDPKFALAHHLLGIELQRRGDLHGGLKSLQKSITLGLQGPKALGNLALIQMHVGKVDKSLENFQKAISLQADHVESHISLSHLLLLKGDFKRGWPKHDWRARAADGRLRLLPFTPWRGEDLSDKHILVYAEQGVGDEVMFSSCLPDLLALSPAKLTFECDPRLQTLFARSFPDIEVRGNDRISAPTDWITEFPGVDFQIPLGSLPRHFRNSEAEYPKKDFYLHVDTDAKAQWQQRYATLGDGPNIGISWKGGADVHARLARSTTLSQWRRLLNSDATFINLQYGDCAKELSALEAKGGVKVHDWPESDPIADLDDFAAQLAALDLVISIDNSTVHFAAAVGTEVWTLLPYAPEFRWLLEREDSIWYENMRLMRQATLGEWNPVFTRVEKELQEWLSKDRP